MLKLVLLVALVGAVTSKVTLEKLFLQKWQTFKSAHGKQYVSLAEEQRRMKQFLQTSSVIASHNAQYEAGEVSYKLAHNHMSDLTEAEVEERHMGFMMSPKAQAIMNNATEFHSHLDESAVPDNIDWRVWNYVTPVRSQGSCASCYTYSATAALETALVRRTGKLLHLSTQQLVDCTTMYGNYGCGGGYMNSAFQYLKDNGGYVADKDYPYEGKDGKCRAKQYSNVGTLSDFVLIHKGDEEAMVKAVATVGPIAVAYFAGNRDFLMYDGGIYDRDTCRTDYLSHAVTVVGYGIEGDKKYWIVKNSWGDQWGEKGYFRIARGKNLCGIANMVSYPIV